MVAATSLAGPASPPDATASSDTAATTVDTAGASAAASAAAPTTPVAGKPTTTKPAPNKSSNKSTARKSDTYTVVEADGIKIPQGSFDLSKPVSLKKGQMLILKSASGQMIEVDGPYSGKPIDHYTAISADGTMGYDAKSFAPPGHCSGGAPHPSGGPNPDETGGAENQATHCH